MNPTSNKFVSPFLIFSLMMLSVNLHAKERRGAMLVITKKDGQQIRGELIAVKKESLLLITGNVDVEEIKTIRIVKKKVVWEGVGIGLLIGASWGAIHGLTTDDPWYNAGALANAGCGALWGIVIIGIPLAIIGGILGIAAGKDEIIHFESRPPSSIEYILKKLRKKARIRDYK